MANPNWKKGVSGNPNGRPKKGKSLTEALEKGIPYSLVVEKLKLLIEGGDVAAIKYYCDRVEGKPRETLETIIETPKVIWFEEDETNSEDKAAKKKPKKV